MKKLRLGLLITIIVVFVSIIKIIGADAQVPESVDYSSPAIKIVVSVLDAMKNKDYKAAWLFFTPLTKSEFGDLESFEKWCLSYPRLGDTEIEGVMSFSEERLLVTLNSIDKTRGLFLTNEDKKWKVAFLKVYMNKIEKDFKLLSDAVKDYYKQKGVLPAELSQLANPVAYIKAVPSDPFSDGNEPYHYTADTDGWKIYSVGPDGHDDGGSDKYNSLEGIYYGDIIEEGKLN